MSRSDKDKDKERKGRWKKTRNKNTPGRVGVFMEHLMLRTLGGVLHPEGSVSGDLYVSELSSVVEVKGSDNNHAFRLRISQLRSHRDLPFPYFRRLYALGCYNNRGRKGRGEKHRSLLDHSGSKSKQLQILASELDRVYLLDSRMMFALKKKHGVVSGSLILRPEEEEKALRLTRTQLKVFVNGGGADAFQDMKLNPKRWCVEVRKIETKFYSEGQTHSVSFELVTILPSDFHKEFRAYLTNQLGEEPPTVPRAYVWKPDQHIATQL